MKPIGAQRDSRSLPSSLDVSTLTPIVVLSLILLVSSLLAGPVQALEWSLQSTARGDIPPPNTGNQQTACITADMDGDAVEDIIVCERTEAPSVVVYLWRAEGWLRAVIETEQLPIEAGGAVADIDQDGDLDLVMGGDWHGAEIWWWENPGSLPNSDGGWTRRIVKNTGAKKHHDQVFGDFDGDGSLELAFWNQKAGGRLFLAEIPLDPYQSAQWERTEIFDGPDDCEGLVAADINLDGQLDLVGAGYWFEHLQGEEFVAHSIAVGHSFTRTAVGQLVPGGRPEVVIVPGDDKGPAVWYEWQGDSWFAHEIDPLVLWGHSLALGDVNRDGLLDIFLAEMHTPGAGDEARSRIYINQGYGKFLVELITLGIGHHESRLADVNGDGWLDIVGKPYKHGAPGVNVWLQATASFDTFTDQRKCLLDTSGDGYIDDLRTADFDGDGKIDLVASLSGTAHGDGKVMAFHAPAWHHSTIYEGIISRGDWVDLDRDGDLDYVGIESRVQPALIWLENPGLAGGTIWGRHEMAGYTQPLVNVIPADIDNDGRTDIVVCGQTEIFLVRGSPGAGWQSLAIAAMDTATSAAALGDLDRDGDLDILRGGSWWRNPRPDVEGRWPVESLASDTGVQRDSWPVDLNGDGWLDVLVLGGGGCGRLAYYPNDRAGGLASGYTLAETGLAVGRSLVHADMDADGDCDIVLAGLSCAAEARTVFLQNDGMLGQPWPVVQLDLPGADLVIGGDLDVDGSTDVAFRGMDTEVGACRVGIAYNSISPVWPLDAWRRVLIDEARPWRAVFVKSADIDRDGWTDIVAGGWWYRNPGDDGGVWSRHIIGTPLHNAAIVHDFDRDGDDDILGTRGQGSVANAEFVWARNDGAGQFDILDNIEAGTGDFLQGAVVGRLGYGSDAESLLESVVLSWHGADQGIQILTVPDDPAAETWPVMTISAYTLNEELDLGDIDRDGDLDISLGTAWLENAGGNWIVREMVSGAGAPDRHRLVDLNRDGRLDMIVGFEEISVPGPVVWYEQPVVMTQPWVEHAVAELTGPMSLDVADMDHDGDLDVVVGEHNGKQPETAGLYVLENTGGEIWVPHLVHRGDEHHDGAQVVDIDGDGDLDIVSIGWFHDDVVLYENLAVNTRGGLPIASNFSISPNPFNSRCTIRLVVALDHEYDVTVYDWHGRLVNDLLTGGYLTSGTHIFTWDGTDRNGVACSSGTYFVQVSGPFLQEIKKVVFAK